MTRTTAIHSSINRGQIICMIAASRCRSFVVFSVGRLKDVVIGSFGVRAIGYTVLVSLSFATLAWIAEKGIEVGSDVRLHGKTHKTVLF